MSALDPSRNVLHNQALSPLWLPVSKMVLEFPLAWPLPALQERDEHCVIRQAAYPNASPVPSHDLGLSSMCPYEV